MGTSLGFWGHNCVPSSDIGSTRSVRLGPLTYEAKPDVVAVVYNSQLCGDITFLSSYSKYTQNLGSIEYLMDLSDFRVPSYGLVSDLRGESPVKPIGLGSVLLRFKPKIRDRTVTRHMKVRKDR